MNQIRILWCVVLAQAMALGWVWHLASSESVQFVSVAGVAENVTSDSAIQKMVNSLEGDVMNLKTDAMVAEKQRGAQAWELQSRIDDAAAAAQEAKLLQPSPLEEYMAKNRREGEELKRRIDQDDNEKRLDNLERARGR